MDPLLLSLIKFSSVQLIGCVHMTITYIFDDFFRQMVHPGLLILRHTFKKIYEECLGHPDKECGLV